MPEGYEFVRMLGAGSSGSVALARQTALDRLVAIKTVHAARYSEVELRRLEREGRALARLQDERIVAVYALETIGDDLALVLEYAPSGDLRRALDAGSLQGPALRAALDDVAGALAKAASVGVVHRDVKPANVLLGADGHAKLADFGIARLSAAAGAFRTGGSVVIGTPLYIAPEQIDQPDVESPAADAYSFAVLAYEVLAGRPPFVAPTSQEVLEAHRHARPPSPREFRPDLGRRAERALLAGLAKDPAERPTPTELMAALPDDGPDWIVPRPLSARVGSGTDSATEGAGTSGPEPHANDVAEQPATRTRTVQISQTDVRWLDPEVPAGAWRSGQQNRRISPLLVGALIGVSVALIVLALLALTN